MASQRHLGNRRVLVLGCVALVASSAFSWWIGTKAQSPGQAAAAAAPPRPSLITARVERRRLSETLALAGTVTARHELPVTVDGPVGPGRTVVTGLPWRRGDTVDEGAVLLEVSGRPIFLLQGATPTYRDLRPGMRGDDVGQLQVALARFGYQIWDRRGYFGRWTARAVRRFYRVRGYEAASEDSADGLGGSTDPGQRPDADASASASNAPRAQPSRVGTAPRAKGLRADPLVVPYVELVYMEWLPAVVTSVTTAVGQKPDDNVMRLAAGTFLVEAPLTSSDRQLVRVGDDVVVATTGGAKRFRGEVTRIVAASDSGGTRQNDPTSGNGPGADATAGGEVGRGPDEDGLLHRFVAHVATSRPLSAQLLHQEVEINVSVESTDGKVLAVPASAIWATAAGSTKVTRVAKDGSEVDVAVRPGLSAGGFVAVRPAAGGLQPGDLVVVGR